MKFGSDFQLNCHLSEIHKAELEAKIEPNCLSCDLSFETENDWYNHIKKDHPAKISLNVVTEETKKFQILRQILKTLNINVQFVTKFWILKLPLKNMKRSMVDFKHVT